MKKIPIDLHMHSHYSNDGEYTVDMLVNRCIKAGIRVFSMTDHNSVLANKEAVRLSSLWQMEYIPNLHTQI